MKILLAASSFIVVGWLMSPVSIVAHHSTADYETKSTTVDGTVTDYKLMNPHTQIFFDVKDDKGHVEKWVAETNSAVALYRTGWTKTTLKPGDRITATGNRAMNGTTLMHLRKILLDGQELPMGRQ
jgi:uncharacterized protein DUF6152